MSGKITALSQGYSRRVFCNDALVLEHQFEGTVTFGATKYLYAGRGLLVGLDGAVVQLGRKIARIDLASPSICGLRGKIFVNEKLVLASGQRRSALDLRISQYIRLAGIKT